MRVRKQRKGPQIHSLNSWCTAPHRPPMVQSLLLCFGSDSSKLRRGVAPESKTQTFALLFPIRVINHLSLSHQLSPNWTTFIHHPVFLIILGVIAKAKPEPAASSVSSCTVGAYLQSAHGTRHHNYITSSLLLGFQYWRCTSLQKGARLASRLSPHKTLRFVAPFAIDNYGLMMPKILFVVMMVMILRSISCW